MRLQGETRWSIGLFSMPATFNRLSLFMGTIHLQKGVMRFSNFLTQFLLFWFCSILGGGAGLIQADQRSPELHTLFDRLQTMPSAQETQQIEREIWRLWTTSEDETTNALMQNGMEALRQQNFQQALEIFAEMTTTAPDFAEGWNKRATVHYLLQNYEASLSDIEKTLSLEPRHFGALSGQGLVHLAQKNYYEALRAFEQALEIHPALAGAKINIHLIKQYLNKQTL